MNSQLRNDVEAIATDQGRTVGTAGHRAAREYLVARCRDLGLIGYSDGELELPYQRSGVDFCNVVGVLPGSEPTLAPILLGAHYDTFGMQPGADDNAAAVAIMLSMVEPLRWRKLRRPVVFAFFDAEEPPHFLSEAMGSIRWYEDQRRGDVHCAVVLDLVGHDIPAPGLSDLVFMTGMESDPGLEEVFRAVQPDGIRIVPSLTRYVGDLSDYYAFRNDQRPYLFFSCGHWEHYHKQTDTADRLIYDKMSALSTHLSSLVTRLDKTELAGPFEGYDTTATEIELLTRHFAPILEASDISLNTREDVDRFVLDLKRVFGL